MLNRKTRSINGLNLPTYFKWLILSVKITEVIEVKRFQAPEFVVRSFY